MNINLNITIIFFKKLELIIFITFIPQNVNQIGILLHLKLYCRETVEMKCKMSMKHAVFFGKFLIKLKHVLKAELHSPRELEMPSGVVMKRILKSLCRCWFCSSMGAHSNACFSHEKYLRESITNSLHLRKHMY